MAYEGNLSKINKRRKKKIEELLSLNFRKIGFNSHETCVTMTTLIHIFDGLFLFLI